MASSLRNLGLACCALTVFSYSAQAVDCPPGYRPMRDMGVGSSAVYKCVPVAAPSKSRLRAEPAAGQLPSGQRVLVDDGSCPKGQIKEVTGGSSSSGRQRRCVAGGGGGSTVKTTSAKTETKPNEQSVSSERKRARHDKPPAIPPTLVTFLAAAGANPDDGAFLVPPGWNWDTDDKSVAPFPRPGLDKKWFTSEGGYQWPDNQGFKWKVNTTLTAGERIGAYGPIGRPGYRAERGSFAAKPGVPYETLSLPYDPSKVFYYEYEVTEEVPVEFGEAEAHFDQPGGALQYRFAAPLEVFARWGIVRLVLVKVRGTVLWSAQQH